MRQISKMITLLLVAGISIASCSKNNPAGHENPDSGNINDQSEKGFATGIVNDPSGKPMAGVKILANHHTWYNTVVIGVSDENGKYKLNLKDQPAGSWDLYGEYRKTFNGVVYTFQIITGTDPR
ncbi:MAG: carboxypeptidase regulatory-like domain-containing protein [Chitinophagaceae bacterium]|nr:MAG: carboxypeptidase regulatory-like domain-containing protein [Chitinophagaceae bacterium]